MCVKSLPVQNRTQTRCLLSSNIAIIAIQITLRGQVKVLFVLTIASKSYPRCPKLPNLATLVVILQNLINIIFLIIFFTIFFQTFFFQRHVQLHDFHALIIQIIKYPIIHWIKKYLFIIFQIMNIFFKSYFFTLHTFSIQIKI